MSSLALNRTILGQHAEDAQVIRSTRSRLVVAPHVGLDHLARIDERLSASLDGLLVGWASGGLIDCTDEAPSTLGRTFLGAFRALATETDEVLDQWLPAGSLQPDMVRATTSAFGWVSESRALSATARLLHANSDQHRLFGIAGRAINRLDAGEVLRSAIEHGNPVLRRRALAAVGELGRTDLIADVRAHHHDADALCVIAAAESGSMIGDQDACSRVFSNVLARRIDLSGVRVWMLPMLMPDPSSELVAIASRESPQRGLYVALGSSGLHSFGDWLLDRMIDSQSARPAAEAFNWITGADLVELGLDRDPPEDFQSGPNDDPNDENVAMDEDEDLPWPDPVKVADWWHKNKHNFQPGVRYFMGKPVTVEHCIHVLKTGKQRQRFIAARYLKLLQPERPLFNCAAPAWRQQALLAKM